MARDDDLISPHPMSRHHSKVVVMIAVPYYSRRGFASFLSYGPARYFEVVTSSAASSLPSDGSFSAAAPSLPCARSIARVSSGCSCS